MKKSFKLLMIFAFAFFANVSLAFALSASDWEKVDSDVLSTTKNPLHLIDYTNKNTDVSITYSGNKLTCGTSVDVNNTTDVQCQDSSLSKNMNDHHVLIPASALGNDGASIVVTYPKVGTYNGKEIGVKATYTVYEITTANYSSMQAHNNISTAGLTGYNGITIAIPFNFYTTGTGFFNSKYDKCKYEFFYSDTKQSVNVSNASFVYHSLNYIDADNSDESVFFDANMVSRISGVQTIKDTNIDVRTSAGNVTLGSQNYNYSLAFVPVSKDGFDEGKRNTKSYYVNSAGITYSGVLEFILGSSKKGTLNRGDIMFAPSTTSIKGEYPEKPVKNIIKSNTRVKQAEYEAGSNVVFEVKQKVNTLNENILMRYTGFSIVDELPQEVDYVSAKLYDEADKEVTDGTITYDKNSHTVTWEANSSFLSSMKLSGETYSLVINAKLNSKMKSTAKNSAYSLFNNKYKVNSNEVIVTIKEPAPVIVDVPSTMSNTIFISVGIGVVLISLGAFVYIFSDVKNKKKK